MKSGIKHNGEYITLEEFVELFNAAEVVSLEIESENNATIVKIIQCKIVGAHSCPNLDADSPFIVETVDVHYERVFPFGKLSEDLHIAKK